MNGTIIMDAAGLDIIADHVSPGSQGWKREATFLWTREGMRHKIRATIYRDFYAKQSRIYVEVWSPATLSWNTIRTLSGMDHDGLPSSSVRDSGGIISATDELVEELVGYAQEVLA